MDEEKRNGCTECMRYGFVLMNATFLLLGVVISLIGAWFYAIPATQNLATVIFNDEELQQFNNAVLLVICVGAAVCFAACVSCCGAFARSRCLLIVIFVTVAILLIAELAVIGFGTIFIGVLSAGVSDRMSETLALSYAGDHSTTMESIGWREMQKKFLCCGVNSTEGYQNHTNVQYGGVTGSLWYRNTNDSGMSWPVSCCRVPQPDELSDDITCQHVDGHLLNQKGCQKDAELFFREHLLVLISIVSFMLIFQIIAAVIGYQLYKDVPRPRSEAVDLDIITPSKGYDRFGNAWPSP